MQALKRSFALAHFGKKQTQTQVFKLCFAFYQKDFLICQKKSHKVHKKLRKFTGKILAWVFFVNNIAVLSL